MFFLPSVDSDLIIIIYSYCIELKAMAMSIF
jgi:hypothetical protein